MCLTGLVSKQRVDCRTIDDRNRCRGAINGSSVRVLASLSFKFESRHAEFARQAAQLAAHSAALHVYEAGAGEIALP
jgi:hypothetical protein